MEPLKVLCVEDDEDILYIIALSLALDKNIVVHIANSGSIALDILQDPFRVIDCILLDVQIPDMSGIDVLTAVRGLKYHQHTPIVFLTASVLQGDIELYNTLDISGIITKPFDPLTLASDLRSALNKGL